MSGGHRHSIGHLTPDDYRRSHQSLQDLVGTSIACACMDSLVFAPHTASDFSRSSAFLEKLCYDGEHRNVKGPRTDRWFGIWTMI